MNTRRFSRVGVLLIVLLMATTVFAADWSYDPADPNGPANWGHSFPNCDLFAQSPIDILTDATTRDGQPALALQYRDIELNVYNNGHTIQVNNNNDRSRLRIGKDSYDLLQFHVHTPSEHLIDGAAFPMEAHLVHQGPTTGEYAMIGVMMELGDANSVIELAFVNAPNDGTTGHYIEGTTDVPGTFVSPYDLLPQQRNYYTYDGSFTTPPCTEGVRWIVLKDTVTVSQDQVDTLEQILDDVAHYPYNARPVQALNGRTVIDRNGKP